MSFWLRRREHQIMLPNPGPYLSPALVTGLNSLIPEDHARFWFHDCGASLGVVSRATTRERDTLQRLTGLRLDADPPDWWTAIATLPVQPPGPPR